MVDRTMTATQLQALRVINFGFTGTIIGVDSGHDTVSIRSVPNGSRIRYWRVWTALTTVVSCRGLPRKSQARTLPGRTVALLRRCRVATAHYCAAAPLGPCMRLSPHTARARPTWAGGWCRSVLG